MFKSLMGDVQTVPTNDFSGSKMLEPIVTDGSISLQIVFQACSESGVHQDAG